MRSSPSRTCCMLFLVWLAVRAAAAPELAAAEPGTPQPGTPQPGTPQPGIRLEQPPGDLRGTRFIVTGLPRAVSDELGSKANDEEGWRKLLAIHTVLDGKPSATAMVGEYQVTPEGIAFTPRYALRPGMTYLAVFDPQRLGGSGSVVLSRVTQEFRMPSRPPRAPKRLTEIFPSGDVLPENLLKFYLHFSEPMSRGEAYRRIRLLDDTGQQVDHPFLELSEELWSPDGKRFTLYFDPGRIKRGLKPRELFGPALIEGRGYSLVIDGGWPDADDQELAETVRKTFRVVAPDDSQPNPARWSISAPAANTRESLTVDFDKSLDAGMLQRVLAVYGPGSQPLSGTIRVSSHERRWQFQPGLDWVPGIYRLVIATVLEDTAGNSIGRPFEVDVFRPAKQSVDDETVELKFSVR